MYLIHLQQWHLPPPQHFRLPPHSHGAPFLCVRHAAKAASASTKTRPATEDAFMSRDLLTRRANYKPECREIRKNRNS